MIALSLLFFASGIEAQTTQARLNLVELMKQFSGTRQTEMARDTTRNDEYTAFGNAVIGNIRNITKGKVILSVKELWGYDE